MERNKTIDLIRGLAILLIPLGHTIMAIGGGTDSLIFK